MKKIVSLLSILILLIVFISPEISEAETTKRSYLISFNNDINEKLISEHGGNIKKKYKFISVVSANLTDKAAQALSKNPDISHIEENAQVHAMDQEIAWGIPHINADDVNQLGGTGSAVKIGVMDTGIDYTHEDLKVVGGETFIEGTSDYMDDNGHGSHVAGIISALNNNIGVLGVAPEANLYAIKVLDQNGNGNYSDVIAGIEWAILNNIDIINMSLGSSSESLSLQDALDKAYNTGILIVASAGNNGYSKKGSITYPAKYSSVISVGAVNQNDYRAEFSSVGKELELVAPGIQINSTVPGGYAFYNGTSMAAPYVSGVATLLMDLKPELSNIEIRKILNQTSKPLGDSFLYGNGLVDALTAINYVDVTKGKDSSNNIKENKKN
ncbi:S8 family serine peptidase [Peribacillus simplex]|uniref:S8 family serine peptidase n=2 Tax=Peribacillus TaxID=2675229 RepID=A0AA90P4G7_9BACI|nr:MULTISPECIES: S8 family peptidase [Peribacillus]MDP1420378.1 S8 family serine peptidase [Peribacillus simplex]MDP1453459.1 S8 family serine peptidase [Peribacillus frigoritolerans]